VKKYAVMELNTVVKNYTVCGLKYKTFWPFRTLL
jgi:hypothetical protein